MRRGPYFEIGDIIDLEPLDSALRVAAVVVEHTDNGEAPCKCIFLDWLSHYSTNYIRNRGWFVFRDCNPCMIDNPTDEQCALAMRIMLTGYMPGVDDE